MENVPFDGIFFVKLGHSLPLFIYLGIFNTADRKKI